MDVPDPLWLTGRDLELLRANDAQVTQIHAGYVFKEKAPLYREHVDDMYKVKADAEAEGKSGQREVAKRIVNGGYGGQLQHTQDNVETQIIHGTKKVLRFLQTHTQFETQPLPGGGLLCKGVVFQVGDTDYRHTPSHHGTLLLAGTRIQHNEVTNAINPWRREGTMRSVPYTQIVIVQAFKQPLL